MSGKVVGVGLSVGVREGVTGVAVGVAVKVLVSVAVGVMLGVAVLIIVISVMSGFDRETRNRLLGFNTHMRIVVIGQRTMPNYRDVMKVVASNALVKATAPYVIGQVMIETQPQIGNQIVSIILIASLQVVVEDGPASTYRDD